MNAQLKKMVIEDMTEAQAFRKALRTAHGVERAALWAKKRRTGYERRVTHLACCYLRGTPYELVESKTRLNEKEFRSLVNDVHTLLTSVGEADLEVSNWMRRQMNRWSKLYVVVRSDLPAGAQAVQSMHALREFAAQHPEIDAAWHSASNRLAVLGVPTEHELKALSVEATLAGVPSAAFLEEDLGGSLTALALAPSATALVRGLPLALHTAHSTSSLPTRP